MSFLGVPRSVSLRGVPTIVDAPDEAARIIAPTAAIPRVRTILDMLSPLLDVSSQGCSGALTWLSQRTHQGSEAKMARSGRGAAWLARQSGGLEVPSSNLGAPIHMNEDELRERVREGEEAVEEAEKRLEEVEEQIDEAKEHVEGTPE